MIPTRGNASLAAPLTMQVQSFYRREYHAANSTSAHLFMDTFTARSVNYLESALTPPKKKTATAMAVLFRRTMEPELSSASTREAGKHSTIRLRSCLTC